MGVGGVRALGPGTRLHRGRFELLAVLGRGGSGVVWRALDRREARECALKLMPAGEGGSAAAEREAEVAARVAHPGVVRIDATFEDDGWAGIAMELCTGSVADRVEDEGPLPANEALRVVGEALAALVAAHRVGVVHRDVKPHNLLLRADGSVAVADWGIARALMTGGGTRTTAAAVLGTLPFLAPELRANPLAVSPSSDLFAVGASLAWICAGKPALDPFVPEGESALRHTLPPAVADVVVRACAWAPEGRYVDADVMRTAVEEAVGRVHAEPRPSAPTGPKRPTATQAPRPPRRWGWVGVGAGVVTGLAVGALVAMTLLPAASPEGSNSPPNRAALTYYEDLPACDDAPRIWNQRMRSGPRETLRSVIADVDEDTRPDLLFLNQQDESLTLYRAATGGIEGDPSHVPAGRSGDLPLVVDQDGDGHVDVLLALKDDSAFGVLRGRGDGTFAPLERVFQGPPPTAMYWLASSKRLLFGTGPAQLALRSVAPVIADWGPGKTAVAIDGWEVNTFLRRNDGGALAVGGKPFTAVEVDATGRAPQSRVLPGWPAFVTGLAADLLAPYGEDELYSVSVLGQVLRHDLNDGSPICRFGGRLTDAGGSLSLGDLDGDGLVDAVGARTCAGCTSNHVVWMGGR